MIRVSFSLLSLPTISNSFSQFVQRIFFSTVGCSRSGFFIIESTFDDVVAACTNQSGLVLQMYYVWVIQKYPHFWDVGRAQAKLVGHQFAVRIMGGANAFSNSTET